MPTFGSPFSFRPQAPRRSQQDLIAAQLLRQGSSAAPVQSGLEGLARALTGVVGGFVAGQAQNKRHTRETALQDTLGRALSASDSSVTPAQNPSVQGAVPQQTVSQVLAGNPDTARFGLARQLEQRDSDRNRQQAREDFVFQQQNKIAASPSPFSLSPGQTRFDASGREIAAVDPKSDVLSSEAFAQKEALRRAGKPITNITNTVGGQTKGRTELDKKFAAEFNDLVAGGGFADIDKGLEQLNEVVTALESGKDLTGTLIGNMPKAILSATNPDAVNTQELVEEVVQRNLRLILGAQFTEKEGERLIARAYNPRLDEATNAKRVKRLMRSIKRARDAKFAASEYFEANGTLTGFRGATEFTAKNIAADADLPPAGGSDFPNMTREELNEVDLNSVPDNQLDAFTKALSNAR